MVFSSDHLDSLQGILSVLHEFHMLSGLQISQAKSELFCEGIAENIKIQLASAVSLKVGTLPVRYLGVSLVFEKLKDRDCKPLLDKITARISAWTYRFLSMAGRLQLVTSVLNSMYAYWCNIFLLPTKVMRTVESICCAFLWKGTVSHAKGAKVRWEVVCLPKSEGGLGIKRLQDWNISCLARLVWLIFSGSESLWIAWVHSTLLKGRSFWTVKIHLYHSWCWKKILKLRDKFLPMMKFLVGNGETIFIWHDPWHPRGPLLQYYGSAILYGSGASYNAKLPIMIQDNQWSWPTARSRCHIDMQSFLSSLVPAGGSDSVVWLPSTSKTFQVTSTWQMD